MGVFPQVIRRRDADHDHFKVMRCYTQQRQQQPVMPLQPLGGSTYNYHMTTLGESPSILVIHLNLNKQIEYNELVKCLAKGD